MDSMHMDWNIRIGDFYAVDRAFMKKLCERNGHYGNAFIVLPLPAGRPGFIVGLKLITTCICKTISDGVYQGALTTPKPFPSQCLFVNAIKLKPIWGEKSSFDEFQENDICQVFLPSIERHYFGVIRSFETRRHFQVHLFDCSCQFVERFNSVRPEYQENFVDGPNVLVTLKCNFVQTVFRCSEVRKGDFCRMFVPGQGKFECLFEKRVGRRIQVRILERNLDMAKVNADERFLQKVGEDQFCVKDFFLQFLQPMGSSQQKMKRRSYRLEEENAEYQVFDPTQENMQCYRSECFPRQIIRVTLLEGNIAVSKVKTDRQCFRQIGEAQFDVSETLLELLESTTTTTAFERRINSNQNFRVKAGDICRLVIPGQGRFQCLVDQIFDQNVPSNEFENKRGTTDRNSDEHFLEKIGDGKFEVSDNLIEILQSTTEGSENVRGDPRASKGDICRMNVPGQGKFQCLVEGRLSKDKIQVSILEGTIDITKLKTNSPVSKNAKDVKTLSQNENFAHFLPKSAFYEGSENSGNPRIFEGDICMLLVPGQGKFQCLVEKWFNDRFEVSVLEGVVDVNRVKMDATDFTKVGEGRFCVNENYLELVQATTRKVEPNKFTGFVETTSYQKKNDDFSYFVSKKLKPLRYVRASTHIGNFKGIQGHNNSCYMDSLLYSLFLFNDSLDQMFELNHDDELIHMEMKSQFRRLIVNPLRNEGRCYVKQENVMHLRRMLEPYLPGICHETKDPIEFLTVLFSNNFAGKYGYPPLLHVQNALLNDYQNLSVYQIIVPTENQVEVNNFKVLIPHLGDLVAQSFLFQSQFLKKNPHTLLIQLPRFGKEKLFPGVYLPTELDISAISASKDHKCGICEEIATLRCQECSSKELLRTNATERFGIANFCNKCFHLIHKTKENHRKEFIPPLKSADGSSDSCCYSLKAVICIETRHYVSFVRAKKEGCREEDACWLFFDSMANTVQGSYENIYAEHNVSEVREVSHLETHLNKLETLTPQLRYDYLISRSFSRQHQLFQRFLQDAYICVYIQK